MLDVLKKNNLFVSKKKERKCVFACLEVEYLEHLISSQGVRNNPKKTTGMIEWPLPKTVKALIKAIFKVHRLL